MGFPLPGGRILAVEYDGAYWHRAQEERDLRKTDMIQWSGQYCVVRIREDPLVSPQPSGRAGPGPR
jgi:very-short-patch-repair endonuclease